ncbi:MAG: Maf-like protein [Gammaproteobacteria bacterium]|nr:MAG: Maf-like protein [Gammaproteobacteria bacterium]
MSPKTARPLILASSSPYRRRLLRRLALPFEWRDPAVDETARPGEAPETLVRRLAKAKATAPALGSLPPDALVIGSDQVAVLDGEVLGKPGDHERARAQLARCSGREVVFYTGVCLYDARAARAEVDCVPFTVVFRPLDAEGIERYLRHDRPYDAAGSFKAEGLGITLFRALRGDDPTALEGLPLIRLTDMLAAAGVSLP